MTLSFKISTTVSSANWLMQMHITKQSHKMVLEYFFASEARLPLDNSSGHVLGVQGGPVGASCFSGGRVDQEQSTSVLSQLL